MAYVYIKALEDLAGRLGPDMSTWTLEKLQMIHYEHVPLSKTPFKKLYETIRPMAGNRRTPNVAIYFFHKTPYSPRFGPIIRLIADMNDQAKVYAALDTGIEQRFGSDHQTDMMDLFHKGEYVTMPTTVPGSEWPKGEEAKVLTIKKTIDSEGVSKEEF